MSVFVIIVALLFIGRSGVEAQKEYQAEVKNDTGEEFVVVNIETYYSSYKNSVVREFVQ